MWSAARALTSELIPALLLQTDADIVEHFRLRGATPPEVLRFVILLSAGLLVLGAVCLFYYRRWLSEGSLRRRPEPDLYERLEARGVRGELLEALERVAIAAEATLEDCAHHVEHFDRGVERLIVRSAFQDSAERLELLRAVRALRRRLDHDEAGPLEPLRSTRCLPVDQEIVVTVRRGDRPPEDYAATVFHNQEDAMLLRLLPREEQPHKRPFVASVPSKIRARFFRPNEGSYEFEAPLVEYRQRGPGFLRLLHARALRRCQRRNYHRAEVDEPVRFSRFPRRAEPGERRALYEELAGIQVSGEYAGRALDLSGGGVRLATGQVKLALDDWLELRLSFLPENLGSLSTIARVVQVYSEGDDSGAEGVYGVAFESPPARLEAGILREVERRLGLSHAGDEDEAENPSTEHARPHGVA